MRMRIIPALGCGDDLEWLPGDPTSISQHYSKLRKVRKKLISLYITEFLRTLANQATFKPNRYKPVLHGGSWSETLFS